MRSNFKPTQLYKSLNQPRDFDVNLIKSHYVASCCKIQQTRSSESLHNRALHFQAFYGRIQEFFFDDLVDPNHTWISRVLSLIEAFVCNERIDYWFGLAMLDVAQLHRRWTWTVTRALFDCSWLTRTLFASMSPYHFRKASCLYLLLASS